MDEIMQCSVCCLEYDTESRKPCIGKCGHSICVICANDERCKNCPICRRDGSFQDIVVSYVLMNIIEFKNKNKQEMEGICSLCKKESRKLFICIDCNLNKGILRKHYSKSKNEDEIGVNWNTENQSSAECIKQAEFSSFCGDCSIHSVHYGHRIGSFKKIQQTIQSIFSKGMSGIKEQIEGFLSSFDKLKEEVNQKLEEYRNNISSLLDYVAQLTIDSFANYPSRVMEFIEKSKVQSKGITCCHQNILNSIDDIEKKLLLNALSNCATEKEEIVYYLKHIHYKNSELGKLEIYAYNTISNTMKMETELSVPYNSNSIVHKNNVYIIGGRKDGNALKTVEVYNLNDKTRRKLADLNEAQSNPLVCMHNGKIIVYSGYNKGYIDSLEEYDFDKNKWKIIGRIDDDSDYYRIVSHENDLYGVCINIYDTITIYKFNKKKSVFEKVLAPTSVSFGYIRDCTSFNGKIFILAQNYYWHYNPSTNELSKVEEFGKEKEYSATLHSLNNQLYAIDSKSVEMFVEKNNKWYELWRKQ